MQLNWKSQACLAVLGKINASEARGGSSWVPARQNWLTLCLNYIFNQIFPSVLDRKEGEGVNYRFPGLDFGVILVVERARLLKSHLFEFLISCLLIISSWEIGDFSGPQVLPYILMRVKGVGQYKMPSIMLRKSCLLLTWSCRISQIKIQDTQLNLNVRWTS